MSTCLHIYAYMHGNERDASSNDGTCMKEIP